ncbi:hypothetical protein [Paenibacillus sp. Root444D2]|uniref:hypothetical protein n=1 Tax=Paenibacillus sp. Root444D2 TaxID=1736538 RepID=UPI00070FF671|nr:hypothetical protein [Paenibacillus sp. Root444D2]KQX69215.1 hypothetical protein ASD40_01575 [Paenibacillus sp. Root444D2]
MGNELTDVERIVRLETKLDTELAAIKEALYDLKKMMLVRDDIHVTKDLLQSELKLRDEKIEGLHRGLNEIRDNSKSNKQLAPAWGQVILAVVAVGVAVLALWK